MESRCRFTFVLVVLVAALAACEKIHQLPDPATAVDPSVVDTRLRISCLMEPLAHSLITKADGVAADASDDPADLYDRRYLVAVRSNEYTDTLVKTFVVTRPVSDTTAVELDMQLQARKYKVAVWMDYVRKGTHADLFYQTSQGLRLDAVRQLPAADYTAGSDYKDAQTFQSDIDLTPLSCQWFSAYTLTAPLTRPLAKITLLADDLPDYAATIGYTGPLADLAGTFRVVCSYEGYYPTSFDAFTSRLNDADLGYFFHSSAAYPYLLEGGHYCRLGYDYVYVNGEESQVSISVSVRASGGMRINDVSSIAIPVRRGQETIVIFRFLTSKSFPGVGIQPAFDGEYNIYVS